MKIKNIIVVQIVLLAGVMAAGLVLKSDIADGPRTIHRTLGMLAGLTGLVSAVLLTMQSKSYALKLLSWLAVGFSFVAGYAGNALKSASDYDMMFNLMRGSGFLALVLAIVVFVKLKNTKILIEDN